MNRSRRTALFLLVLSVGVFPTPLRAGGLDGPADTQSLHARVDPTGAAVGAGFPTDAVAVWGVGTFDYPLLATSLLAGARYDLVTGPKYELDLWAELGPRFSFRGLFAAGGNVEVGGRNLFGTPPVRWSAGAAFDTAFNVVPVADARYRPKATAGLGLEGSGPGALPESAWLRGSLGYDFRPDRLGAVHADIWLALRWSLFPERE